LLSFEGRLLDKHLLDLTGPLQALRNEQQRSIEGTARSHYIQGNSQLPSLAGGSQFNDLGPADDDFTFDMEDLQWLDAVQ
jgi:hypothetical protein